MDNAYEIAKKYKLVIFDFDGVLVDSTTIWDKAEKRLVEKNGGTFPLDYDERKKEIIMSGIDDVWRGVHEYLIRESNVNMPVDEFREKLDSEVISYYLENVLLKPGVKEYILYLKEKNIKMMVASANYNSILEGVIRKNGLDDCFINILGSGDVTNLKPEPDVYNLAHKLSGLDKKECLIFDDSLEGVTAGYRSGIDVCSVADHASLRHLAEIKKMSKYHIKGFLK